MRQRLSEVRYKVSNQLQHLQIYLLSHCISSKAISKKIKENKEGFLVSHLNFWLIKKIAYVDRDVRAPWIGAGQARTQYAPLRPFADWANEHWRIYNSFDEFFEVIPSGTILDIGCGTGNMTVNLSSVFENRLIFGLDLNKRVINFAKKFNSAPNLIFKVDNAFAIKYHSEFSAIFAIEILEHLEAKVHFDFIDGCMNALKPGGLLFLSTPNEPFAEDAKYGHIGFLNSERWKVFYERYKNDFVDIAYIDNSKLLDKSKGVVIKGTVDDYCAEDGLNRSHFRIVMQA